MLHEGLRQVVDEGHAQGVDRRAGQRDPGDRVADLDGDGMRQAGRRLIW
jgi:hypothetical protein